jgi:hypothetical protein
MEHVQGFAAVGALGLMVWLILIVISFCLKVIIGHTLWHLISLWWTKHKQKKRNKDQQDE